MTATGGRKPNTGPRPPLHAHRPFTAIYFYRLSDPYEDGAIEPVEDLALPEGLSDVWFRGRVRRKSGQLLGTTEVWLARYQAGAGWQRYVVEIEEQDLRAVLLLH